MAVMNLNRVYYCCLYGNNEEEVIIRHIDRDMDYESELISLEEDFWLNNVQAQVPPPYFEDDGELILESLRRLMGPSSKDALLVAGIECHGIAAAGVLIDSGAAAPHVGYNQCLHAVHLGFAEDARTSFPFGDHLIRFTAVGYDLPRTDSIKMELEGTSISAFMRSISALSRFDSVSSRFFSACSSRNRNIFADWGGVSRAGGASFEDGPISRVPAPGPPLDAGRSGFPCGNAGRQHSHPGV